MVRPIFFPSLFRASLVTVLLSAGCTGKSSTAPSNNTPPAQPLSLTCPAPIETASQTGSALQLRYATATAIGGSAPVQIACTPDNDSFFPTGTTPVTCTGTDSKGVKATCSFNVHVVAPGRVSMTNFTAFGDSMTAGEVVTDNGNGFRTLQLDYLKSYPYKLQQMLIARYGGQTINVSNQGRYGETTAEGAARLSGALPAGSQVLLLMEGANDIANVPLATSIANMRSMVQTGRTRGQRVFVVTIPPQSMVSNGCPVRNYGLGYVAGYNNALRSMAASEGATVVDVYTALLANTSLYIDCDGLHPTAAGYQKIAEVVFEAIKTAFETQAPASRLTPSF